MKFRFGLAGAGKMSLSDVDFYRELTMIVTKSKTMKMQVRYLRFGCVAAMLLIALGDNVAYGQKRSEKPLSRPRLLFSPQDIEALKKKAGNAAVGETGMSGAELWKRVLKSADSALGKDAVIPPEFEEYAGRNTANSWLPLATAYALTSNQAYLDQLRKNVRTVLGWKTWGSVDGFSVRVITIGVAATLDVAWDKLPKDERQAACKALVERGLIPLYEAGKNQSRAVANNNNGIFYYSALGLGAMELLGEKNYPQAQQWVELACDSMKKIFDSADPDGSWGEGIGYGATAFNEMCGVAMLDAMKRLRGTNLFEHKFVKNLPLFAMHTMRPGGSGGVGFNDTWQANGFQLLVMKAAGEYDMPQYDWYLKQTGYKGSKGGIRAVNDFLQYRPGSKPQSPDGVLPVSRYFSGLGWATCRTAWDDPDAVLFAFQSERVGHAHEHNSMNHFEIHGYGSRLATSPGYHHGRAWRATMGHNLIWVDGKGQHFAAWGSMGGGIKTFLGSSFFDYVVGQTNIYGDNSDSLALKHWRRHVVFAKPDYLVFFDDIESCDVPREYKWILNVTCAHAIGQKGKFEVKDDTFVALPELNPTGQLSGKVISPSEFSAGSAMWDEARFKETYGPYYSITPKNKSVREKFLVVLYPQPRGAEAPKIQGFEVKNGKGIEVVVPDGKNLHLYRLTGQKVSGRDLETDGLTCMVGNSADGNMISYAMCEGKEMKQGDKVLISCSEPVSAAFAKWSKYTRRADRLPVKAVESDALYGSVTLEKRAGLRFLVAHKPKSVKINGKQIKDVKFDEKTGLLSVSIPAGRCDIEVK